ncbi:glycosyltransferase family 4 protein [Lysobacter fragariae]
MKLLYTNFHAGEGGGHTTYLVALARSLATRHEVVVAAPEGSRLLHEAQALPGVRAVAQAFPNGLGRWRERAQARRALARLLHEEAFDVVHVNGSADHRLVLSALRGLQARPRIVLTKHNSKPVRGLGHWWRARNGTDQVIAVCDYTLRDLQQSVYRRCGLDTVHNGVDIDRYAPASTTVANAERARWFAGAAPALVLGSNAGTADYKGWMDLVEALALLPAVQRDQVRVLLAGKPPTSRQRERIAALGLDRHVVFTGLLDDVRPAMAAVDVGFVLSFDVETISFACREMMAMGKPVLLTSYAGLPENITPGREGWLVPVRDPAAIAVAVSRLLGQRAQLPAMGAAARSKAVAEFGVARFAQRTEAVYRRLLHQPQQLGAMAAPGRPRVTGQLDTGALGEALTQRAPARRMRGG